MLSNTLCHIPRISLNKERVLWEKGIQTWASYRTFAKNPAFLDDCEHHLKNQNPVFFAENLKSDQHWRLFPDFQDSAVYLDIETTGLDKGYDHITTIALFDGKEIKTYVHGKNLTDFTSDIQKYKLLITFNGKTFDVPFIERFFGIELPQAHIDLRYIMKKLGYSGGLKEVERRIGLDRGNLRSVDGFFAVTLWQEYKRRKNDAALETLLAYNCMDAINLERLMIHAYNENIKGTPFWNERQLQIPKSTKIPFQVDERLIRRYL
ncbi:MAG: ribonuclease H-like domain-containing protein [Oligoflexales bacterium]|nr:ribonuclease H-like domain-containing protein [Oligoflexales bacterium]